MTGTKGPVNADSPHAPTNSVPSTASGKRYRVRDDRGRGVSMLDPVTLHMLRRHDIIDREALDAISRQIGPGTSQARRVWYWILFTLSVTCLIAVIARVIATGWNPDSTARILWLLILICLPLGLFLFWRSARQGRLQRVRSAMLDHRCCPHCGYNLTGLPYDTKDDATICPECGCAWKLNPVDQNNNSDDD